MNKIIVLILFFAVTLSAMSLDEAIKKALRHNNSLKKAILDKEVAKKNKEFKKASNLGRFDLKVDYNHYNKARTLSPLLPMDIASSPTGAYEIPTTKDLISAGIAYNIVLFDGFKKQNSYKISSLAHKSSLFKVKLAKEELIYNVKSLYLSLLSLQEQLNAQKKFVNSQKRLYNYVLAKYKLGSKSRLDLLESKNSYTNALSTKEKIKANIEILKATLSKAIGSNFDKAEKIKVSFKNDIEKTPY